VLRQGQPSFRDFCVGLFARMRRDQQRTHVSWGYNEVVVWFEAARYLADQYAGDPELGAELEEIARHSHDSSGPIIALAKVGRVRQ
jgi:hypothetical protein